MIQLTQASASHLRNFMHERELKNNLAEEDTGVSVYCVYFEPIKFPIAQGKEPEIVQPIVMSDRVRAGAEVLHQVFS